MNPSRQAVNTNKSLQQTDVIGSQSTPVNSIIIPSELHEVVAGNAIHEPSAKH